jgi:hypothetical protein
MPSTAVSHLHEEMTEARKEPIVFVGSTRIVVPRYPSQPASGSPAVRGVAPERSSARPWDSSLLRGVRASGPAVAGRRRGDRPRRCQGLAGAADWDTLRSSDTYVDSARGERRRRRDPRATGLALNQWALAGDWSVGDEAAVLEAAAGSIAYRFQARDLNPLTEPRIYQLVRHRGAIAPRTFKITFLDAGVPAYVLTFG